eukprot:CAMPEP_0167797526 /NCGR_PEP_ID=MMETSP0111_2-20121227/15715_1 /TAXON_ID=91324 /ORGANISM="Lotharella globosa, Strain CCCM811" /LENGTH=67 /DNA_ID=CAMNT_0007691665 /DNA_START=16 /DNA_END=216 /DNA_ORIENTATION=-
MALTHVRNLCASSFSSLKCTFFVFNGTRFQFPLVVVSTPWKPSYPVTLPISEGELTHAGERCKSFTW